MQFVCSATISLCLAAFAAAAELPPYAPATALKTVSCAVDGETTFFVTLHCTPYPEPIKFSDVYAATGKQWDDAYFKDPRLVAVYEAAMYWRDQPEARAALCHREIDREAIRTRRPDGGEPNDIMAKLAEITLLGHCQVGPYAVVLEARPSAPLHEPRLYGRTLRQIGDRYYLTHEVLQGHLAVSLAAFFGAARLGDGLPITDGPIPFEGYKFKVDTVPPIDIHDRAEPRCEIVKDDAAIQQLKPGELAFGLRLDLAPRFPRGVRISELDRDDLPAWCHVVRDLVAQLRAADTLDELCDLGTAEFAERIRRSSAFYAGADDGEQVHELLVDQIFSSVIGTDFSDSTRLVGAVRVPRFTIVYFGFSETIASRGFWLQCDGGRARIADSRDCEDFAQRYLVSTLAYNGTVTPALEALAKDMERD